MSGVAASFDQATGILKLLCETRWTKEEMQRRFFAHWGILRVIGEALGDGKLSEEQVRAMHPLFYKKGAEVKQPEELPTKMTVGGIVYEIIPILRGDEKVVSGATMVEQAKDANAYLGEEDGQNLLKNWRDIPVALRGKVGFVFPGWRRPGDSAYVACVDWDGDGWYQGWYWLDRVWVGGYRVLRRK